MGNATASIDDGARFHVFGDESSNAEIVAYALVIVPAGRVGDVESEIRNAKAAFRGSPDASLHCKTLLHGDRRARSAWSHLGGQEVFGLLADVMRRARQVGARAWIGYLDRRGAPDAMLFEDNGSIVKQQITELHLLLFAYWAAMGPVQDIVSHRQMRAWMDPNKDRLRLLDQHRKQFRLSQGFFPVHHENQRFEPLQVGTIKPPILQLADIVAHCGARALSTVRLSRKEQYEAVLARTRPGLSTVEFDRGPGPMIAVRANTAAVTAIRADFAALGD